MVFGAILSNIGELFIDITDFKDCRHTIAEKIKIHIKISEIQVHELVNYAFCVSSVSFTVSFKYRWAGDKTTAGTSWCNLVKTIRIFLIRGKLIE